MVFSAMIIGSPAAARMEATSPSRGSFHPLISTRTTSGRMRSRRSRKLLTSPTSWCSTMMRNGRSAEGGLRLIPEFPVFDCQSDGQRIHVESPRTPDHSCGAAGGRPAPGPGWPDRQAAARAWYRHYEICVWWPAERAGLPCAADQLLHRHGSAAASPVPVRSCPYPACIGISELVFMKGWDNRQFGTCLSGGNRPHHFRSHDHQQFRVVARELLLLNSLPSNGMLARPGILLIVSVMRLSIRPAITKLWPLPVPLRSARGACSRPGWCSRNGHRVGIVQRAHLRRYLS